MQRRGRGAFALAATALALAVPAAALGGNGNGNGPKGDVVHVGDIKVKKLQSFGLKPGTAADYKLVDIKETEAVIQLPNGEKYTVVRDPRKAAK